MYLPSLTGFLLGRLLGSRRRNLLLYAVSVTWLLDMLSSRNCWLAGGISISISIPIAVSLAVFLYLYVQVVDFYTN